MPDPDPNDEFGLGAGALGAANVNIPAALLDVPTTTEVDDWLAKTKDCDPPLNPKFTKKVKTSVDTGEFAAAVKDDKADKWNLCHLLVALVALECLTAKTQVSVWKADKLRKRPRFLESGGPGHRIHTAHCGDAFLVRNSVLHAEYFPVEGVSLYDSYPALVRCTPVLSFLAMRVVSSCPGVVPGH